MQPLENGFGKEKWAMAQEVIRIETAGPGLYEFSGRVRAFCGVSGGGDGLLTVYVRHTSCSLLIQENADPDVQIDLHAFFSRLVPQADDPSFSYLLHRTEGPDDMPAHIKAALTQTSIGIPVRNGQPLFGTWQGIYLFEHRAKPHTREIVLHLSP